MNAHIIPNWLLDCFDVHARGIRTPADVDELAAVLKAELAKMASTAAERRCVEATR